MSQASIKAVIFDSKTSSSFLLAQRLKTSNDCPKKLQGIHYCKYLNSLFCLFFSIKVYGGSFSFLSNKKELLAVAHMQLPFLLYLTHCSPTYRRGWGEGGVVPTVATGSHAA